MIFGGHFAAVENFVGRACDQSGKNRIQGEINGWHVHVARKNVGIDGEGVEVIEIPGDDAPLFGLRNSQFINSSIFAPKLQSLDNVVHIILI